MCPTLYNPTNFSTPDSCPSLSPQVCLNSCPLSQWCYLTILLSATSLSFGLVFFPISGSFPMSWLFASGDRSIGASASVLPMNIQGWFPLGLTGLISLQSKGLSRVFSSTTTPKHQFLALTYLYGSTLTSIHDYQKIVALTIWTFGKVLSLFFNTLSRFATAFLRRSKHFLISWLQSLSTVILEHKEIKSVTASTFSLSICHEVIGLDAIILFFECWVLSQLFHFPLWPSSRGSWVPLYFLPLELYCLHILGCWYFSQKSRFQFVIHPARHFTWCTLHGS